MIVYRATNSENGKIYIGQTSHNLEHRRKQHIRKAKADGKYYFHNALRKYGKNCWEWQVICICPDINTLNKQEEEYISYYNSTNREVGYNSTSGGLNFKMSEEVRKKRTGKNHPFYGKKQSKEARQKISDNHADVSGKNNPMYGVHRKCERDALGRFIKGTFKEKTNVLKG